MWFLWTSQGAGTVQVDTCGALQPASDSVITYYTGVCGTLTEIACDDDTCATPSLASQVSFTATCDTQYYIRVAQLHTYRLPDGALDREHHGPGLRRQRR